MGRAGRRRCLIEAAKARASVARAAIAWRADRAVIDAARNLVAFVLPAHDMRAFFVTAGMLAGHDALLITDRTGHTTLTMLRTYERDVRRLRELGEEPVDASGPIPELADINLSGGSPSAGRRRAARSRNQ